MRPIHTLIIHCSDSPFGDAKQINVWHKKKGWNGIGYHHVITNGVINNGDKYDPAKDGLMQDGRPLDAVGAHCQNHNTGSIGICLIGNKTFTEKQNERLLFLVKLYCQRFKIKPENVRGHREFDPGKTCPNFDVKRIRDILKGETHA